MTADNESQLHVQLPLDVKWMTYGPSIDDRLTVYGPGVKVRVGLWPYECGECHKGGGLGP